MLTELNKSVHCNKCDVVENLKIQRQIVVQRNELYRQTNRRTTHHVRGRTDKDYGPQAQQPALQPEVLQREMTKEMERLRHNADNWQNIEYETRDQSGSERWRVLQQTMLTASNFGAVCRRKNSTRTARLDSSLLYPSLQQTAEMKYGHDMESRARAELSDFLQKEIRVCGLFIDQDYPFLGASPDGLIEDDGIVEIKCPFRAKGIPIITALQQY